MTTTHYIVGCAVAAGILLALGACCTKSKRTVSNGADALKVLTESDANKKVTVAVGSPFDIQLPANASTGFAWKLAQTKGTSVLQQGEAEYVTDAHPEGMVGVPGRTTFHFVAKESGITTLGFEYARPWEKVSPVKTYTVTIDVK